MSNLIGREWASLKVVDYDVQSENFVCECKCGGSILLSRFQVTSRKRTCCNTCKQQRDYWRSIQIDQQLLREVSDELREHIVRRFIEHVRLSHRNHVRATSFARYVAEIKDDPDALAMEAELTADERVLRATCRRYSQYQSPSVLQQRGEGNDAN